MNAESWVALASVFISIVVLVINALINRNVKAGDQKLDRIETALGAHVLAVTERFEKMRDRFDIVNATQAAHEKDNRDRFHALSPVFAGIKNEFHDEFAKLEKAQALADLKVEQRHVSNGERFNALERGQGELISIARADSGKVISLEQKLSGLKQRIETVEKSVGVKK